MPPMTAKEAERVYRAMTLDYEHGTKLIRYWLDHAGLGEWVWVWNRDRTARIRVWLPANERNAL